MTTFKLIWIVLLAGSFLVPAGTRRDEEKRLSSHAMKRALAQALITYLLAGLWLNWYVPAGTFAIRLALESIRRLSSEEERLAPLIMREMGNLLLLAALAWALTRWSSVDGILWLQLIGNGFPTALALLVGFLLSVMVGSRFVEAAVQPLQVELAAWRECLTAEKKGKTVRGLRAGGRIIGTLERALIYVFILLDQPEALGFLIAAKSIFRIG
ncbi:MAG: hypothetical protein JXA97_00135 [Anaerolineales bacterium]|nr:hypothetical protein [Anaerolineales bacterium]